MSVSAATILASNKYMSQTWPNVDFRAGRIDSVGNIVNDVSALPDFESLFEFDKREEVWEGRQFVYQRNNEYVAWYDTGCQHGYVAGLQTTSVPCKLSPAAYDIDAFVRNHPANQMFGVGADGMLLDSVYNAFIAKVLHDDANTSGDPVHVLEYNGAPIAWIDMENGTAYC